MQERQLTVLAYHLLINEIEPGMDALLKATDNLDARALGCIRTEELRSWACIMGVQATALACMIRRMLTPLPRERTPRISKNILGSL